MITITNERFNGEHHSAIPREVSPCEAFEDLAIHEFGFGGVVQEIAEDKLVVVTNVFGCTDKVTFAGPVDEMRSLVCLAAEFVAVRAELSGSIADVALGEFKRLNLPRNPLMVTTFLPMLVGQQLIRFVVLRAFGLDSVESLQAGKNLKDRDFVAAAHLAKECNVPFCEVVR